ncbi:MAG: hypothetical protein ACK5I7_06855 [Anaerotignum sp.]
MKWNVMIYESSKKSSGEFLGLFLLCDTKWSRPARRLPAEAEKSFIIKKQQQLGKTYIKQKEMDAKCVTKTV